MRSKIQIGSLLQTSLVRQYSFLITAVRIMAGDIIQELIPNDIDEYQNYLVERCYLLNLRIDHH